MKKMLKRISCMISKKWWIEDYGFRIAFVLASAIIISVVLPMVRAELEENPFLIFVFVMGMLSLGCIVAFIYIIAIYLIMDVLIPWIKRRK